MDVSEFVVAALLLELTPGPIMAYLATLSLTRGRAPGLVGFSDRVRTLQCTPSLQHSARQC